MEAPLTPTSLAAKATISVPYASQIISGRRKPALALALHIFRTTGWKHPSIAILTSEQIEALGVSEVYVPRAGEADPSPGNIDHLSGAEVDA